MIMVFLMDVVLFYEMLDFKKDVLEIVSMMMLSPLKLYGEAPLK